MARLCTIRPLQRRVRLLAQSEILNRLGLRLSMRSPRCRKRLTGLISPLKRAIRSRSAWSKAWSTFKGLLSTLSPSEMKHRKWLIEDLWLLSTRANAIASIHSRTSTIWQESLHRITTKTIRELWLLIKMCSDGRTDHSLSGSMI